MNGLSPLLHRALSLTSTGKNLKSKGYIVPELDKYKRK